MTVAITGNGAGIVPPQAEPKQVPNNGPKLPKDNTAANQSPKETKSAVDNTFGKVPQDAREVPKKPDSDSKSAPSEHTAVTAQDTKATPSSGDAKPTAGASQNPKLAVTAPDAAAPDPKSAAVGDTPSMPPVDPKVQSILDAKLPDGKSVKEKFDADTPAYIIKAAQDHYNLQKEKGEALDAISKFYLNNTAQYMAQNGVKEADIDPAKLADVFDADKITRNIEELAKDPAFGKWIGEQQANAIQDTIAKTPDIAALIDPYKQEGENFVNALRRMQSDYMTSQDFADGVATAKDGQHLVVEGLKTLSSLGLGEKELLGVGNTLAENIRSKYAPDAPKSVIDPNTNKAMATEDGFNLAVLPDGTHVALGTDGKPVADKQGNPYVYNPDRTAKVDASNAYVQYHAKSKATFASYGGIKYMIGADGKTMVDVQGRPLAIDNDGGAPVALGKDGKAAADKTGNKLVIDPNTGKAVTGPETGNAVVIDPKTKGIVQADAGGKIVAGKNGDPYAVDQKTGKFVQDAQGNYVQISKDNVAPGIVPGYVVDKNNTKVVVSPANGKPMVDPRTGMTVVLDPKTNAPQLVPLDSNGVPKMTLDGKSIVYDETGHTVVANTGKGPNWLVDKNGKYATDGKGNYIGVHQKSGLAAAVDAKGAPIRNASGQIPLWDPKIEGPMKTGDHAANIVVDAKGNLLAATEAGQTLIDPGTSMPYLIDPKTRGARTDPDSGQPVLLDTRSNLPFEYNGSDGYKYLVDLRTNKAVTTANGTSIVIDDNASVPYAVKPDGTVVKNPDTGNVVVYDKTGQPAKEALTGKNFNIEITANGKAAIIDPLTKAPIAQPDKQTGNFQLFNPDGTETVNPDTGNKIQMDGKSGAKVEINAKTNQAVKDESGNVVVVGPHNKPLRTPAGNPVVIDKETGAPIAVDEEGKAIVEPNTGYKRVVNTETGDPLADPKSGAPVVADPKSGAPVQVGPTTGKVITDETTGLPVVANPKTGEQFQGPAGEPVVMAPGPKLPVYVDKANHTLAVMDLTTGKPMVNPDTGAKVIIDPDLGMPAQVLPDKDGNLVLVDNNGNAIVGKEGNTYYFDPKSGQVAIKDAAGNFVDAETKEPLEFIDFKWLVNKPGVLPIYHLPPKSNKQPTAATAANPVTNTPSDTTDAPADGNTDVNLPPSGNVPPEPSPVWEDPTYTMTPEERAEFKNKFPEYKYERSGRVTVTNYDSYAKVVEMLKARYPELSKIPTEDLVAVRVYAANPVDPQTGVSWSDQLNDALKSGDPAKIAAVEIRIKALASGLNAMNQAGYGNTEPVVRFKDMTPEDIAKRFGLNGFHEPGFMSTSADPYFDWPGNVKMKINALGGVNISNVEPFPLEQVVYRPGFTGKAEIDGGWGYPNATPEKPDVLVNINEDAVNSNVPPPDVPPPSPEIQPVKAPSPPIDTPADTPIVPADAAPNATAAGRWAKLGKALGFAGEAFGIATGGLQAVMGGYQIDEGIKNNNPYDIAAGAFNVASGGLAVASSVASGMALAATWSGAAIWGASAAAAAALPLAVASVVAGGIAGIIDFVNSLDDDEQFADELGKLYEPLGILKEGWRPKAEEAHRDGYSEYYQPNNQA